MLLIEFYDMPTTRLNADAFSLGYRERSQEMNDVENLDHAGGDEKRAEQSSQGVRVRRRIGKCLLKAYRKTIREPMIHRSTYIGIVLLYAADVDCHDGKYFLTNSHLLNTQSSQIRLPSLLSWRNNVREATEPSKSWPGAADRPWRVPCSPYKCAFLAQTNTIPGWKTSLASLSTRPSHFPKLELAISKLRHRILSEEVEREARKDGWSRWESGICA